MSYRADYPNRRLGGSNPYWCCAACGISDPQINGRLSGHLRTCTWRMEQVGKYLAARKLRGKCKNCATCKCKGK